MLEREVKLGASPEFRLPELDGVLEGSTAVTHPSQRLVTTYLDTEDLRLARWGCSLRYRAGEGWTVKLPAGDDGPVLVRSEHTFEGSPRRPPHEALDLLTAYLRDAALQPSASLRAVRARVELKDAEDRTVAEVVDDEVSILDGRRLAARFRELELESRDGASTELVQSVLERLRAAGAGSPDPTPKYVRAVGPRALDPPEVDVRPVDPEAAAGDVVRQAIAASVVRLMRHDAGVRLGEDPEAVHQARVATRRLRSDLRTFRELLAEEWTTSLRDELSWLAGGLGAVRDADVLLGRLRGRLETLPVIRASDRLLDRLVAERDDARNELLGMVRSGRYRALVERLVVSANQPALLPEAAGPAAVIVPALVDRPWGKLKKAVGRVGEPPADEELHRVRIAAKRCRYAAEAVAPVLGKRAASFAKAASRLQDVLGEHQDAVVAHAWLREAAARARPAQAFVAGELAALEIEAARASRAEWATAWRKLKKRKPGTWS